MLEIILLVLAIAGVITTIVGHVLVVRGSDSTRPVFSFILLTLVPILNLIYLVRHYTRVKRGAFLAIAGMWLTVPYAGVELWHKQDTVMQRIEQRKKEFAERMEKLDDTIDTSDMSAEEVQASMQGRSRRVVEKEKLVAQLTVRLKWWFTKLEQQRAALPPGNETALQAFNAEAAAYASLNVVAKEKNAELLALRSVVKR